jgi:molybdopterin synthase catalytic subunit
MAGDDQITVLAFAGVGELLGWQSRTMPLPPQPTIAALLAVLEAEAPRLSDFRGRLHIALNRQYATPRTALKPGDEVALIPPVSGGEDAPVCLTREPIDVAEWVERVAQPQAGAIAVFVGTVRSETSPAGAPLEALEYSAYEAMAFEEMLRLLRAARERQPAARAVLVHRLGVLRIGDASVACAVAAPHRAEAFDLCRVLIEELKARVPIFKREIWADGSRSWVEPDAPPAGTA